MHNKSDEFQSFQVQKREAMISTKPGTAVACLMLPNQVGFKGYAGMEYIPRMDAMQTLADVKQMAEGAFRRGNR